MTQNKKCLQCICNEDTFNAMGYADFNCRLEISYEVQAAPRNSMPADFRCS